MAARRQRTVIIVIILIVLIAVGVWAGNKYGWKLGNVGGHSGRQAVFLDNGQVYFGYTKDEGDQTVLLSDIYYLQVQQPVQGSNNQNSSQSQQISLVKLGNELHGPKDEMRINRDHILFVEDMKSDSKVNQAIKNYVANGSNATTTASPSPTAKP